MAQGNGVFRQEAIDRLSSPDELTECLKVTNPSVWVVLIAVFVLLLGLIAWASVGSLPTKADARAVVQSGIATIRVADPYTLDEGMQAMIGSQNCAIESTAVGEDGETLGIAHVELPDGSYDGTVVVEETRAIDFLMQSS